MDISSFVADAAQAQPDKTALRLKGCETTYATLETLVGRLAAGLADRFKVAPGDRVAYLGQNSAELLQVLFACARVGAIFAPLNNRMTAEQLRFFLDHLEPAWLIADSDFAERARDAIGGGRATKLATFEVGSGADNLLGEVPMDYCAQRVDAATPAIIVYTSGTTGKPKGVMHSHDGMLHGAQNSVQAYEMTSSDQVLTFIPLGHVGGLAIQTVPALYAGATVTILPGFEPGAVLRAIEDNRITLMVSRPHASKDLVAHPDWPKTDLSSLRSVNTGSTTVPLPTMLPWFERGITVQHNFGMSEALPPALITSIPDAWPKLGSLGKPARHVEARIVDDNMRDLPAGGVGQIVLRGPSILDGYWRNPEATEAAFRDGWFLTGDLGHRDAEGYFYYDDRIKDVVKVDSYAVYPTDIVRILEECPAIDAAAAMGVPDERTGETVVAFVVVKKGHHLDYTEVLDLFAGRLADYQIPTDILFRNRLPLNPSGKLDRAALRRSIQVSAGRPAVSTPA